MDIFQILSYGFVERALIAGSFIAILCSTLGMFLVLRKMSLIGDGLSHVSFGALALGMFLGMYSFYVAIPLVVLGSFLILQISEKTKVYGDSAIGIVSSVGISTGVILASLSGGFNVDLFSYLFGSILSISNTEVIISIILSIVVFLVIVIFFNDLFSATFDEEYAKTIGIKTDRINFLLMTLTAITVVLAIKVVGVMLVSALLILPAVTALQLAGGFKSALVISSFVSVISVISGIILSFYLDIPSGATIVFINLFLFFISFLSKKYFSN